MLFSDDAVASFINRTFEPAWESVRSVPKITIDFGDGRTFVRTLHGNIASYVCGADGSVIDVLPGIYEPETYRRRLEELAALHRTALRDGTFREVVSKHHTARAARLAASATEPSAGASILPAAASLARALSNPEGLAGWDLLAVDTEINDTVRRRQIHQRLQSGQAVTPKSLAPWLYREVLHADLDDPYLGLEDVLFGAYAFAREDRAAPANGPPEPPVPPRQINRQSGPP